MDAARRTRRRVGSIDEGSQREERPGHGRVRQGGVTDALPDLPGRRRQVDAIDLDETRGGDDGIERGHTDLHRGVSSARRARRAGGDLRLQPADHAVGVALEQTGEEELGDVERRPRQQLVGDDGVAVPRRTASTTPS